MYPNSLQLQKPVTHTVISDFRGSLILIFLVIKTVIYLTGISQYVIRCRNPKTPVGTLCPVSAVAPSQRNKQTNETSLTSTQSRYVGTWIRPSLSRDSRSCLRITIWNFFSGSPECLYYGYPLGCLANAQLLPANWDSIDAAAIYKQKQSKLCF